VGDRPLNFSFPFFSFPPFPALRTMILLGFFPFLRRAGPIGERAHRLLSLFFLPPSPAAPAWDGGLAFPLSFSSDSVVAFPPLFGARGESFRSSLSLSPGGRGRTRIKQRDSTEILSHPLFFFSPPPLPRRFRPTTS